MSADFAGAQVTESLRPDESGRLSEPSMHVLVVLRDHVATDHRLRGVALKILIYLLPELLDRRFRVVKQVTLSKVLRLQQGIVSDALQSLVASGFLERERELKNGAYSYRLSSVMLSHFRYRKEKSEAT